MLYVPLLQSFGYDFKSVAIPSGLLLNGVTVMLASVAYLRAGMVDVKVKGAIPLIRGGGDALGCLFDGGGTHRLSDGPVWRLYGIRRRSDVAQFHQNGKRTPTVD